MSFPVTRIAWLRTEEKPSPEAQEESLKIYSQADGFLKAYLGQEVEDPSTYYLLTEWESRDKQEQFLSNPVLQPFFKTLQALTNDYKTYDVPFDPVHPEEVFSAPVTALSWVTLKEEKDRLDLKDIFMHMAKGADNIPGVKGWSWGTTLQNENQYVFAVGWESDEAYQKAAAGELAQFTLQEIQKLADVEVKHVKLQVHEKH